LERPALFDNNLPPSALVVKIIGQDDPVWVVEGQVREVEIDGENYQLYFGKNLLKLPITLHLNKFTKKDYLGTDTPMSFESSVTIDNEKESYTISMNEPLKTNGFTIYQSSYQLQPNGPAISIFSVNKDPGRWIKYLGSLIMAIGIIIFTFMRSSYYRASKGGVQHD
jgi:ResB-like family